MTSIRVTCTNPDTFQNFFAAAVFSFAQFLNQNSDANKRQLAASSVLHSLQTRFQHTEPNQVAMICAVYPKDSRSLYIGK